MWPRGSWGRSVGRAQAAVLGVAGGRGADRVEHVAAGPGRAQEHIWSSPRGWSRSGPEEDKGGPGSPPAVPAPSRGRQGAPQHSRSPRARRRPRPPPRTRPGARPAVPPLRPPAPTPALGPRQREGPGALPGEGQVMQGEALSAPPPILGHERTGQRNWAGGHRTRQRPPVSISAYPKALAAPGIFHCPLPHVHVLGLPFSQGGYPCPKGSRLLPGAGGRSRPGHRPVCTWKGEGAGARGDVCGASPPHPSPPFADPAET